eukprot:scaffold2058_cov403-Prasinococcus_capsulatus_cf.AAC.13
MTCLLGDRKLRIAQLSPGPSYWTSWHTSCGIQHRVRKASRSTQLQAFECCVRLRTKSILSTSKCGPSASTAVSRASSALRQGSVSGLTTFLSETLQLVRKTRLESGRRECGPNPAPATPLVLRCRRLKPVALVVGSDAAATCPGPFPSLRQARWLKSRARTQAAAPIAYARAAPPAEESAVPQEWRKPTSMQRIVRTPLDFEHVPAPPHLPGGWLAGILLLKTGLRLGIRQVRRWPGWRLYSCYVSRP